LTHFSSFVLFITLHVKHLWQRIDWQHASEFWQVLYICTHLSLSSFSPFSFWQAITSNCWNLKAKWGLNPTLIFEIKDANHIGIFFYSRLGKICAKLSVFNKYMLLLT
jgi:hypothetical protein